MCCKILLLTVEGRLLLEVPALQLKRSAILDIFSLRTPLQILLMIDHCHSYT